MSIRKCALTVAALGLLSPLASAAAASADADKSVAELSAEWWQWAQLNGFPDQGVFDVGNIDCSAGQSGDVWFLAGFGRSDIDPTDEFDEAGERFCLDEIPHGTKLFFPLVNVSVFNPEEACENSFCTVPEKRTLAREIVSDVVAGDFDARACFFSAALDGVPVVEKGIPIQRAQSPTFQGTGGAAGDSEVVSDGYWVLLPELEPGDHTIEFTGGFCQFNTFDIFFGIEVRYELTVADDDDDRDRLFGDDGLFGEDGLFPNGVFGNRNRNR